MKYFTLKTCLFIIPFIFIYFWNITMYDVNGNDLIRLGYIPDFYKETKQKLYQKNEQKCFFDNFYTDKIKNAYDVLILGDSFSEENHSFSNKIAKNKNVLLLDGREIHNPYQRLIYLINSDFFKNTRIKTVILESVERSAVERTTLLNLKAKFKFETKIIKQKNNISVPKHNFFSNQSIKFSFNSFKYFISTESYFNESVYMFKINSNLFTHYKGNSLLVVNEDITNLKYNNNIELVRKTNKYINVMQSKLSVYNIKLILLICPDKYDIYYKYIENKKRYIKPTFFDYLIPLQKEYILVNSKKIIEKELQYDKKDLYYYDDTHWSPITVKIISDSLLNLI